MCDSIFFFDIITMSCRKFFQHVIYYVRFYVLTAASMKLGTFWDIALCSLGVVDVSG
jgi:hypothetical protein